MLPIPPPPSSAEASDPRPPRPERDPTWKRAPRIPAGVALIVLCLSGMVALPYWAAGKTAELQDELRDTLTPLEITLERLHREILGLANDVQGFLLTGDRSFLREFEHESGRASADFERAKKLASRIPSPSAAALGQELTAAQIAYTEWLTHSREVIEAKTREEGLEETERQGLSGWSIGRLDEVAERMNRIGRLARAREGRLRENLISFQRVERSLILVLGTLAAIVVAYLSWLAIAFLRAQRLALDERDQLEAVLASVDSGILLLDRDLRVAGANGRARSLLGIPLRRLVGEDQRRIVRDQLKPLMADPEGFEKRLTYLYDNPDSVAEDIVEVALPEPRTLSRFSSPVRDETGAVFGRIEVYRDVTEVLRRERELAEANERKDRFVATLSHELRTPLTPIFGWLDLLKNERDPSKVAKGLKVIRRNVSLEAQLVEDLLDLSKVVNQKLEMDFGPMDLASSIEDAVETVRHLADSSGVRLDLRLPHAPVSVVADETRFIQIVWNLLSNAIKFSRSGGRVTLTADVVGDRLEVVVQDEGEGIRPDFLPHIFKPFEQGNVSRQGAGRGLGIGLALSHSLVELHGGEIKAESEGPGSGARFTFWIPVTQAIRAPLMSIVAAPPTRLAEMPRPQAEGEFATPPSPAAPKRRRSEPDRGREAEGRQRVLVVEDNPDTLEAMRILLTSWGYSVTAADNVAAALDAVRSEPPEVIISDIGMPHVDGLAFAREVRGLLGRGERQERLVLVAITGFSSAGDRRRALAAGFDAYLTKPIDFESLKGLLEQLAPPVMEPLQA